MLDRFPANDRRRGGSYRGQLLEGSRVLARNVLATAAFVALGALAGWAIAGIGGLVTGAVAGGGLKLLVLGP